MPFLLASTFNDSVGRLTHNEQKQVDLTTMRLFRDPTGNGLQMHRVERAPSFWTVRVSQDLRIVLHKDGDTTLLAWVGHHDAAYRWAERKRLIPHERTGAMQFVEVPVVDGGIAKSLHDVIDSIGTHQISLSEAGNADGDRLVPARKVDEVPVVMGQPFRGLTDDQLLDVGVPSSWLDPVRDTQSDFVDELFELLPAEAAEALLDFATGGRLEDHVATRADAGADPFAHPDAQRRFRVLDNIEELRAALEQPFEKWAVYLHPVQRALVERDWAGPARVTGSAGTGKTIVALHRAAHLARTDPSAKVLLTTFSKPLAAALLRKRDVLTEAEPELRKRITVSTLDQAAFDLFTSRYGQPSIANPALVRAAIADAQDAGLGKGFTRDFLFEEWDEVVDAWNLPDLEAYATVPRIGRRTRLGSGQREAAWTVFEFIRERLGRRGATTWPQLYGRLESDAGALPYSHAVVDEAQDLSVAQVKFLGRLSQVRPDALFLAGDIGQRIFHLPFSWARLGLDIRGRSHALKVNYRTSHQIREMADRLLPPAIADVDGIEEGRRGTVSIFDGPSPEVNLADDEESEREAVAAFLVKCVQDGISPSEIGVLVRSQDQLGRARNAVRAAHLEFREADGPTIAIMHEAKGLEFRSVIVMCCDEDVLPDPTRLAAIGDVADLEAAYETERQLLYVASTRARDHLLISGIAPGSEFLDDLKGRSGSLFT
ncbi:hypothetical protein B2G71_23050 [Novosphingobium sp. PC22D]|uniref:3'-5' exonuclease n=1 Tax=Novosphingobium sp. PC22D TaxID=1962403 RepID=UPI000BF0194E|nr:3'-5' exonuclease [Novosphingobium sp. PC22D]PEQ10296.1 hypothetical protein B2G71_23050 [Novosphingobium sp. PC22D]